MSEFHSKYQGTLMELFRLAGHRPFLAEGGNRRRLQVLGVGPTGMMVGWYVGSRELLELDPEKDNYQYRGKVGGNV